MLEQPRGPLERSLARWAGMSPEVVADGSKAQVIFALRAARHDIAVLAAEVERLQRGKDAAAKFKPGSLVVDRFGYLGTVLWVCTERCPEDGCHLYRVRWDHLGSETMGIEMCERALQMRQDEIAYSVQLTRHNPDGGTQVIEIEHYCVLRELLDVLESEADKNGWMEQEGPSPGCRHPEKCNAAGRCTREIVCNE